MTYPYQYIITLWYMCETERVNQTELIDYMIDYMIDYRIDYRIDYKHFNFNDSWTWKEYL